MDPKTDKVYLAADRGVFLDDTHEISPNPKIIKKKIGKGAYIVIGNAGDFKPLNLISYWNTNFFKYDPEKMVPEEFLIKRFVPEMKKLFDKNDYKKEKDFNFLIGISGEIFEINDSYEVIKPDQSCATVGSAGDAAKAALYCMNLLKIKKSTKVKLTIAVTVACNVSNWAKGTIDILGV